MKKLILFACLFSANLYASDLDTLVTKSAFSKTMTSAIDTVDVAFNNPERFSCFTVVAKSSAVDTVNVYSLAQDGTTWTQHALYDMSTYSAVTSMILSSTAKEFLIIDALPIKFRFVSTSDDASTTSILVQGRTGEMP